MSDVIIHSIHCRGYRGGAVGFDDSDCDCGATIKALTARLAAAEALLREDLAGIGHTADWWKRLNKALEGKP